MRMWMLAAGAAALAITAPALAQHAGGHGGGKDKSAQGARGGGQAKEARGGGRGGDGQFKEARGGGRGGQMQVAQNPRHGGDKHQVKMESGHVRQNALHAQREQRRETKALRIEDRGDRGRGHDAIRTVRADKVGPRDVRVSDVDNVLIRRAFDRDLFPGRGRGLIAGCPPGLDKKNNGCLPPGQANKLLGTPLARTSFANSLLPYQYRSWFRDDDDYLFRAGDGFIYRVDRGDGLIDGIIPMLAGNYGGYGGYYAMGDMWPSPYNFYNVPYQYRSMWADRGDDCYRYDGWGAIYRVDCDSNIVNGIASLLAGDLGVGSPLPMAYNVYNVPLAYRANYYDTPDAWYRYNDGYIYRVDPTTRLITAVIDALI